MSEIMLYCSFLGLGCMTDRYTFIVSGTYNWIPPLGVVLFSPLLFSGLSLIFRSGRKIAKSYCLASSFMFVRLSVRVEGTGRIFIKFDVRVFFQKSVETVQDSLNSNRNKGYST
jgi:hypothetical protein